MINITKDMLFGKELERINKVKNKDSKFRCFFKEYQAIILLIIGFALLAISNGFLVYNFLKTLSSI